MNVTDEPTLSATYIAIITTGGTLASVFDQSVGSVVPQEDIVQDLIGKVFLDHQAVNKHFIHYDVYSLFNIDSSQMLWENISLLAQTIFQLAKKYDAILVVHGTDTMEENAFFVQVAVNPQIPVIFTGAMFSADHVCSDGLDNIRSAIGDCAKPITGVYIRVGSNFIPAFGAYKTVSGFNSYRSTISQERFHQFFSQYPLITAGLSRLVENPDYRYLHQCVVPLISSFIGDDGEIIVQLAKISRVIIIQSLGNGNLPYSCQQKVLELNLSLPIIITSRVWESPVIGRYASATQLMQGKVILCDKLSPIQARLFAEILAASGASNNDIRAIFASLNKLDCGDTSCA